ncbi:CMP-5'-phosphonoformate--3-phosphoglycerate phosphonoformyl transferase [Amycolatopsis sp. MtRt-6]|uniref:CMP-5'-phosphonoformate--3-phosphoglycerate phosphonoformyl transferase n=1 Tax=Amycolatopsis sp. MtRt-6 TaxID=2792782 RepID=UPI001A8D0F04|nr:CMP-5'-phosphonoformate--3-phosphoglycerate phosphonoformyl transferase [Amycolatopsis sp. MtRt-6]
MSEPAGGKTYVVALCGGADRPMAEFGGRTAFEAAATPELDGLAAAGTTGLVTVIDAGITPESDSGAMALLGFDPRRYYTGRGPLEGYGSDFWDSEGSSVAFRVNFASQDPETGRLDRRTSRDLTDEELQTLAGELRAGVHLPGDFRFGLKAYGRHRGIVAVTSRSAGLSGLVCNTDPGFVRKGPFGVPDARAAGAPLRCRALVADPAAELTAELVNDLVGQTARILRASAVNRRRSAAGRRPANLLLFRDGGDTLPVLPGLPDGMRLGFFGQIPAERALARLLGARFTHTAPGPDEDLSRYYPKLAADLAAAAENVVFVHVKGPDEPGHDGRPGDKVAAIEAIDRHLIGPLAGFLAPDDTVVVTCDHATPCDLGIHSDDRVPVLACGRGVPRDSTDRFDEVAAAGGGLPVERADQLLPWLARCRRSVASREGAHQV